MPRLVVYGRSTPYPDMDRWHQWLAKHEVEFVEFDINDDPEAFRKVVEWAGHQSVPTLVIAADDGVDPVTPPAALPLGRGPAPSTAARCSPSLASGRSKASSSGTGFRSAPSS
ncbi:MAG: glutaredoxin family protein [Chloroflexi bacterium]|nr:glutaredoxin family protein [Chloroflexota bacterium]